MKIFRNNKGMTLIEAAIGIAILGIIATSFGVVFTRGTEHRGETRTRSEAASFVASAMEEVTAEEPDLNNNNDTWNDIENYYENKSAITKMEIDSTKNDVGSIMITIKGYYQSQDDNGRFVQLISLLDSREEED